MKICECCGEDYSPNPNAVTTQKYCSNKCKEKQFYLRQKEAGIVRKRKGGYNRSVYVTKFMEARNSDMTAPCTYCKKRLDANSSDWVLDHKIPLSELTEDFQKADNLCVCCKACNIQKGHKYSYQQFLERKQNAEI